MAFQTINPINNKVVKSFDEMTDALLEIAVSKATTTFEEWKLTDYQTR